MLRSIATTLIAGFLLALSPAASAQCFGPDNLNVGGCCAPTQANVPAFDDAAMGALGICWNNCAVAAQTSLRVNWPTPAFLNCAQYSTTVTVTDGATGLPILGGPMVLDYTRTWTELNPATGSLVQVWRFAAKADLSPLSPTVTPPPCPVPPCLFPLGPHQTAFYYGYVDYSRECSAGSLFENVLVLYHGSDWLQHRSPISSKPGVFHPATSYAIVAPHTAATPFVPANLPAPGGPLISEAVRLAAIPGATCITEERIASGDLLPFVLGCMSPPSLVSTQVTLSLYSGIGSCPDATGVPSGFSASSLGFPTLLPWPYLVTTSIGRWASLATYPGQEIAWVDEGFFKYRDSCSSIEYFDVFYGGSTDEGWDVIPLFPGDPNTKKFKDIADNYTAPVVGFHPLPLLGHIMPTDHLIYTNTP